MKKLLMGFATCALILTSCSKNETFDSLPDNMIGFGSISDRLTSRAAGANDAKSNFQVFAQYSDKTDDWYMSTVVNGTDFTYSPIEKWPDLTGGQKLTFYAFAPAGALTPLPGINAGSPVGDFSYTIPPTANVDLTVATKREFSAYGGKVDLAFSHLLSNIKLDTVILIEPLIEAGYTVDVTNATLKISAERNSGSNNMFNHGPWTALGGTRTLYSGFTNYYIMPHAIPSSTTTIVKLEGVKILLNGVDYFEGNIKAEYVPLDVISNNEFKSGVKYKVQFTIGGNVKEEGPSPDEDDPTVPGDPIFSYITFGATTVDWTEETINSSLGN